MYDLFYPYVIDLDSPIPQLFQKIIPKLPEEQFQVTTFVTEGRYYPAKEQHVSEINTLDGWGKSLRAIRTALGRYDLIHTGGRPEFHLQVSRWVHLRNPDIRHVHTLRADVAPDSRFPTEIRRELVDKADVVTAVSEHTAKTARTVFGVDPVVVYNGVDIDRFHPSTRGSSWWEELGDDRVNPLFLFVGSMEKRKNPKDVLTVAKNVPEANFILVGDGPLLNSMREASRDLDNVVLTGRVNKDSLPPLYAAANGFLFPSIREGCPNVVLEAMASGTPVVGYEATAMPELVKNGVNGYLVASDRADALVEVVRDLLDANRSNTLGKRARKHVEKSHQFRRITSDYLKIYEQVL